MSAPKQTKVTQKCSTCGGELIFSPTKQTLVCRQCGVVVPVTGITATEKSLQALLMKAPTWQKDTAVYQCEHCGAKSVVTKFDLIAKCDYCGAESMVKTQELPGVRPDTVVTFNVSRRDARNRVRAWLSKRHFVPNQFKQIAEEQQLHGIYFPAFTFDAKVSTRYTGVELYTKTFTLTVDGKEISQERTIRRPFGGYDSHDFDDLLVLANEEIEPKILQAIQPFDTDQGQVFQQSYLAGFTVCGASKEPIPCWEEAKKSMESVICNKITTKYSNNKIQDLQLDLGITDVTYKYVLLPIYVGHTEYKGTHYKLFINGQTGKIHGKTPKSGWKVFSFFASLGLLALGIGIVLATIL